MSDGFASYSFLPWLRQGIANEITTVPAPGTQRATFELELDITTDQGAGATVGRSVQLVGPGDIVGIAKDAVVRHEPRDRVTNFEPNYLAHIEFYDEDLPWRYSPMPADTTLHHIVPWITLVVLSENEFTDSRALAGPLPFFETQGPAAAVFPDTAQLWAWAHVHVNADLTDGAEEPVGGDAPVQELEHLLQQNPDLGHSRLLCPRKLDPNTAYHAFLIPTFESGRRAGLGEEVGGDVGALDVAWSDGQSRFPYYYRWFFRTGDRGDFEYLVRLLEPRPVSERVGLRDMDVGEPGAEIDGIDFGPDEPRVLGMEGALRSPSTKSTAWPQDYPEPFQEQLAGFINQAEDVQEAQPESDPVITAPLYGRWHALRNRLSLAKDVGPNPYDPQAKWLTELNLDPRHRAAAGLGTRVVQERQEQLMEQAWRQIGDVIEANRRLRLAQLAEAVSLQLYVRHFQPLPNTFQLTLTRPIQGRVLGKAETVFWETQRSKLPGTLLNTEFRKLARPRGRVTRRFVRTPQAPFPYYSQGGLLDCVNSGEVTAAPEKKAPSGQVAIDDVVQDLAPDGEVPGFLLELLSKKPFRWLLWLFPKWRRWLCIRGILSEEKLEPEAVDGLPEVPDFRITEIGEPITFEPGQGDSPEGQRFKLALRDQLTFFGDLPERIPSKPPLDFQWTAGKVLLNIDPRFAIRQRVFSTIFLPAFFLARIPDRIVPVMAYPEFPQPMYEPLRDLGTEFLCPNINLVPPNTIALLETNQKFIESYMVGLNHEMGRELLWREYMTDQRGSYFRQFWNVREVVDSSGLSAEEQAEKLKDIPEIHTWLSTTALGTHNHREAGGDKSQLVLLIRGDLLERYPNTVIYAHRAAWDTDDEGKPLKGKPRLLEEVKDEADQEKFQKYPLYSAKLEPDIYFLGFDLTTKQARGLDDDDPGWFFVLKERVGEPRFGLDLEGDGVEVSLDDWDDLSWSDVADDFTAGRHIGLTSDETKILPSDPKGLGWHHRSNAAELASILFQDPVLVAVHAKEMLRSL